MTITDLPAFAVHNAPATPDFTIAKNNDLDLIGGYIVTIRSEIQVPTDYTGSAFMTMFVEYPFEI